MGDVLTEAFLEMYFARALADLFASVFGAKVLHLWKPSPNLETYVGFDQGWVHRSSTVTAEEFENAIRGAIATSTSRVPTFYVGYFLQFKRVQKMHYATKHTAKSIHGEHFRSELDLKPSPTTGLSQHDTLIRLAGINGADVSYACGMIFDAGEIYDPPDLDKLRVVPVDASVVQTRATWSVGERHFIQFQDETSQPVWCSEPIPGRALSPREWARDLRRMTGEQLIALLGAAREALDGHATPPAAFTVLEFEGPSG